MKDKFIKILIDAGELSSSGGWQTGMGNRMNVSRQTINRWLRNGLVPLDQQETLKATSLDIVKKKQEEIDKLNSMLACIDSNKTR